MSGTVAQLVIITIIIRLFLGGFRSIPMPQSELAVTQYY
jgi:hypothetical protein